MRLTGSGPTSRWKSLVALPWLLLACASAPAPSARDVADANDTGRAISPKNASERELLAQLAALPVGKPRPFGDTIVVGGPAYPAASGRICRSLELTARAGGKLSHRLACSDGGAWFFVPNVLGGNSAPN